MNEMDVAAVNGLPPIHSVRISTPTAPAQSDALGVEKLVVDRQLADKAAVDRLRADKNSPKSGDDNASSDPRAGTGDGRRQDPSVVLSASSAGLMSRRAVAELLNRPEANIAASDVMRASIASAKAFGDEMSRALVTMGHDLDQLVRVMGVSDDQAAQIVRGFIGRFSEGDRDRRQTAQNIGRYQSVDASASSAVITPTTDAATALTFEVRNIEVTISDSEPKVSIGVETATIAVATEQTAAVLPSSPPEPWEKKRVFFDAQAQRAELTPESRGLYVETDNAFSEDRKAIREMLLKTLGKAMLQDDAARAARLQETMNGVALLRPEEELPTPTEHFYPLPKLSEREKSTEPKKFMLDMSVSIPRIAETNGNGFVAPPPTAVDIKA